MEKKKMAKAMMIAATIASSSSLIAPIYSEAQTSACKWKQATIQCSWWSLPKQVEHCVQGGDGNTCTCGSSTRGC